MEKILPSLSAFVDKIFDNHDLIKEDTDTVFELLDNGKWFEDYALRSNIETLYEFLIDFVYFDNQSEYIGFKIKSMIHDIEIAKLSKDLLPYTYIKEDFNSMIESVIRRLTMKNESKYHISRKEIVSLTNEITSDPYMSMDNITTYDGLMDVLWKYSKEERYIG